MDNKILEFWVEVPKEAKALKKYVAKKGVCEQWEVIQLSPWCNKISAFNGPQIQFIEANFSVIESGEAFNFESAACNCAFIDCKQFSAIVGKRVKCITHRVPCEESDKVINTILSEYYGENGAKIAEYQTELTTAGHNINSIYGEKTLSEAVGRLSVEKESAKTLAGLLKICVEDNGKGYNNNFSAVSLEWTNGESVCVVRSYMVGANEQNDYFRIVEQRVKLSAPAVGSGCIYVQSKLLIDLLANDKTIYIINYNNLASKGKNGVQIVMGCNSAISSSSIDAPKAWIKRAAEVQSEIKAQESAPNVESTTAKNSAHVEVAPAVGENQVNAPKVKQTNISPQNEDNITTAVDNNTKKPPRILRGGRIPRPRGSATACAVESAENEIPP